MDGTGSLSSAAFLRVVTGGAAGDRLVRFHVDEDVRDGQLVAARLTARAIPIEEFLARVERTRPAPVPETAVSPAALAHNLRYKKVLHEHVVTLMVTTQPVPHVPEGQRVVVGALGQGVFDVVARYGFMEDPPRARGAHGREGARARV